MNKNLVEKSSFSQPNKVYISYNQIHETIRTAVEKSDLIKTFQPTLLLAISAGGFLPTRILRNIIKHYGGKTLPIQTIGICLYDDDNVDVDFDMRQIRKTQWLTYDKNNQLAVNLQGQNILIVDEVDDTRTTLSYVVNELKHDIDQQRQEKTTEEWTEPKIGIFVVHNKGKEKRAQLPDEIMKNAYFVGKEVGQEWIVYPWDAINIEEHTRLAENIIS
ncbi:unnamed protein product [Didymodactylos carnosus]|uniref:Xanthine phosphoribosyltransferase n=1 Tax=Didymodactylos carnosus TaxID=1234261 RepID=A0A815X910_9BILA|nr:unnamed protein product [Didymodactylos carnosus]CAF1554533.1 unnamed protein product [Didymodactylos carnosus]CAF4071006.1 unnamed protein product [Didymodactylos carnosus]CAF4415731.1 unnamed protein product [Didymodactylos carnosus]